MAKRPWSKAFTPTDKIVHIHISNVPYRLRIGFRAKCKRENKSQRNLLLSWVRNWVEGRRPDEDTAAPLPDPFQTLVETVESDRDS